MVTKEEVIKVAGLAKLEFANEELDALTTELNSVLGYIDQLSELDVSNVEPLENLNEATSELSVLRRDEVGPSLSVEDALRNAPKSADNYFLVPKVLVQEARVSAQQNIVDEDEEELY